MDKKLAQMKKMFLDMGGDEASWEHIELHIKQAVECDTNTVEDQTDGKEG